eukprot:352274-Chlamydomonas_euryale.AAC.1
MQKLAGSTYAMSQCSSPTAPLPPPPPLLRPRLRVGGCCVGCAGATSAASGTGLQPHSVASRWLSSAGNTETLVAWESMATLAGVTAVRSAYADSTPECAAPLPQPTAPPAPAPATGATYPLLLAALLSSSPSPHAAPPPPSGGSGALPCRMSCRNASAIVSSAAHAPAGCAVTPRQNAPPPPTVCAAGPGPHRGCPTGRRPQRAPGRALPPAHGRVQGTNMKRMNKQLEKGQGQCRHRRSERLQGQPRHRRFERGQQLPNHQGCAGATPFTAPSLVRPPTPPRAGTTVFKRGGGGLTVAFIQPLATTHPPLRPRNAPMQARPHSCVFVLQPGCTRPAPRRCWGARCSTLSRRAAAPDRTRPR